MTRKYLPTLFSIILVFLAGGIHANAENQTDESLPVENLYLPLNYLGEISGWIGPDGGTVVDMVIDPQHPEIIYAGSWGAGIFKSEDQGMTWRSVNTGLGNYFIESLAVNPENPDVVYAGTYTGKVYKSINGGERWFLSSDGIQPDAIVYTIAINPDDPEKVYAGTRGQSVNYEPPWNGVLYRSYDAGKTWTTALSQVGGKEQKDWVYSIGINPESPKMIFAATHEHGIFRSDNHGISWEEVNWNIQPDRQDHITSRSVVVDPNGSDGSSVYTGLWKRPSLYRSNDDGEIWFEANKGIYDTHVYQLAVDPINANTIYASTFGRGVMKTTNGGGSWLKSGLQNEDGVLVTAVDPDKSSILYSGTYGGGVYRSLNGGASWVQSQSGIHASNVTSLLISPANPDRLFASILGGGVVTSLNRGSSWVNMDTDLPDRNVHRVVMDPENSSVLYALTSDSGLYKCTLGGDCWIPTGEDLLQTAAQSVVYDTDHPFAAWDSFHVEYPEKDEMVSTESVDLGSAPLLVMEFSKNHPNIAYLGTSGGGLYRSDDGTNSWYLAGLAGETVWSIAINWVDPDILFVATGIPGYVRVSSTGGATWVKEPIPGTVYDIEFAPTDASLRYVGTSTGVYRRDNRDWNPIGLQDKIVTVIAPHLTKVGVIYAGLQNGLYVSRDSGETWEVGPEELNRYTITDISFDPVHEDLVYISTSRHGAYRLEDKK